MDALMIERHKEEQMFKWLNRLIDSLIVSAYFRKERADRKRRESLISPVTLEKIEAAKRENERLNRLEELAKPNIREKFLSAVIHGRSITEVGDVVWQYWSALASVRDSDGFYGVLVYYCDNDTVEMPDGLGVRELENATHMIPLTFDGDGNYEAWITAERGVILEPIYQKDGSGKYRWICGGHCSQGAAAYQDFAKHGISVSMQSKPTKPKGR